MSYYACRDHPEERVTWRGNGCPQCDYDAAERRGEHRKRRPAREPWEFVITERTPS